jgi:anthranilate synthase/aminodeoxychorismate synthase-like glutamine amidotransferase
LHGKTSQVIHEDKGVFKNLKKPFRATRYHSLAVEKPNLPESLEITAKTESGVIMGLRHKSAPIEGVQFHPESILTEEGMALLKNWINIVH